MFIYLVKKKVYVQLSWNHCKTIVKTTYLVALYIYLSRSLKPLWKQQKPSLKPLVESWNHLVGHHVHLPEQEDRHPQQHAAQVCGMEQGAGTVIPNYHVYLLLSLRSTKNFKISHNSVTKYQCVNFHCRPCKLVCVF